MTPSTDSIQTRFASNTHFFPLQANDLPNSLLTLSTRHGASEGSFGCAIEGAVPTAHQPQEVPEAACKEGEEARVLLGKDADMPI